jgi:hypothetical protein
MAVAKIVLRHGFKWYWDQLRSHVDLLQIAPENHQALRAHVLVAQIALFFLVVLQAATVVLVIKLPLNSHNYQ